MVRRLVVVVTIALTTLALSAPGAAALGWNVGAFTGRIGQFEGPEAAEVVCRYDDAGHLRSITIHPLKMWGSHKTRSTVGWRYQLREAVEFQRGGLIYLSGTQKDRATRTVAADEFTKQRFFLTRDTSGSSAYYVRPVMFWYEPGSDTVVEGRGVVLYDRYVKKLGTEVRSANACTYEFADTSWG
jgi:hypothetical protein